MRDYTAILMDNINRAFDSGTITEKERDEAYDDVIREQDVQERRQISTFSGMVGLRPR